MVLPDDLGDCAQNGDQERVFAWLAAGGDINDGDSNRLWTASRMIHGLQPKTL